MHHALQTLHHDIGSLFLVFGSFFSQMQFDLDELNEEKASASNPTARSECMDRAERNSRAMSLHNSITKSEFFSPTSLCLYIEPYKASVCYFFSHTHKKISVLNIAPFSPHLWIFTFSKDKNEHVCSVWMECSTHIWIVEHRQTFSHWSPKWIKPKTVYQLNESILLKYQRFMSSSFPRVFGISQVMPVSSVGYKWMQMLKLVALSGAAVFGRVKHEPLKCV